MPKTTRTRILTAIGCLMLPCLADAQSVKLDHEYAKKISAAREISVDAEHAWGNSTVLSTGNTEFVSTDIDIPGNNALPVRFTRRLPIAARYANEQLSGLGNWDIDVPYVEATVPRAYDWAVAGPLSPNRHARCSSANAPYLPTSFQFTPEEFFDGYRIRIPGVMDEPLIRNTEGHAVPSDGAAYPWLTRSNARVSCIAMKNYAGEGYRVTLPDGTKYFFDTVVERVSPTIRKARKTVLGYSLDRKRVFVLASRIEDSFGNFVTLEYGATGALNKVEASDGRSIRVAYGAGGATATANGKTWTYEISNGSLVRVGLPDGSAWAYSPLPMPATRGEIGEFEFPSLEVFDADAQCLNGGGLSDTPVGEFSVTNPYGARATFTFERKLFSRNLVPYRCFIDFFDHEVKTVAGLRVSTQPNTDWARVATIAEQLRRINPHADLAEIFEEAIKLANQWIRDDGPPIGDPFQYNYESVAGYARIGIPNSYEIAALVRTTVSGPGIASPLVYAREYVGDTYAYCDQVDGLTGAAVGPRCADADPCLGGTYCSDPTGRWVVLIRPDGSRVSSRFGTVFGKNENLLLNETVASPSGEVLMSTAYTYAGETVTAAQPFKRSLGTAFLADRMITRVVPMSEKVTIVDGRRFVRRVDQFDVKARQTQVTRASAPTP